MVTNLHVLLAGPGPFLPVWRAYIFFLLCGLSLETKAAGMGKAACGILFALATVIVMKTLYNVQCGLAYTL